MSAFETRCKRNAVLCSVCMNCCRAFLRVWHPVTVFLYFLTAVVTINPSVWQIRQSTARVFICDVAHSSRRRLYGRMRRWVALGATWSRSMATEGLWAVHGQCTWWTLHWVVAQHDNKAVARCCTVLTQSALWLFLAVLQVTVTYFYFAAVLQLQQSDVFHGIKAVTWGFIICCAFCCDVAILLRFFYKSQHVF